MLMANPTVLTDVGASHLNAKPTAPASTTCRKRKHADKESSHGIHEGLAIKQKGSNQLVGLTPRAVVIRSQIPLTYLDTRAGQDHQLPPIFHGVIKVLESQPANTLYSEEAVLIAEDRISHALFAVERCGLDKYALCKLHDWVAVEGIEKKPAKRVRQSEKAPIVVSPWWMRVLALPRQEQQTDQREWTSTRQRFSMRAPATSSPVQAQTSDLSFETPMRIQAITRPLVRQELDLLPAPEDLLNAVRAHYLDSLYTTRTPIAYFAKGPLSRARAATKSTDASALKNASLVEFLRSCIMTLNMGTKKYDVGLAELVRELPPGTSLEDDEAHLHTPIKDRIRKSRKRKNMSKTGFMPGEEECVLRWWIKREESLEYAGPDDTRESRIKSGLAEQRARETQLQIVLILETLALEAAAFKEGLSATEIQERAEDREPAKKKKPLDLMNVLDVLIDHLCIWESMNLDGSTNSKSKAKQASSSADNEQLRDFCTDVVVPYYSTRLPDLYGTLCQKLGGPTLASSPPALRTPAPKKAKRPVKKAPEKTSSRRAGGLTRSATDSQLQPLLRRELSGVDLADFPRHRPTLQESGRYAQREVDLAAVSKGAEMRAARKAAADAELRSAIAALRRPNPRAAVRDIVESADRRNAVSAQQSKSRKPKNPMRNPFAAVTPGVQVAATPRAGRQAAPYALLQLPELPPTATSNTYAARSGLLPGQDITTEQPCLPSPYIPASSPPKPERFPSLLADTPLRNIRSHATDDEAEVDVDATPSRKRAYPVPARRPTNPLDAAPSLVFSRGASGAVDGLPEPRVARSPLLQRSRTMPTGLLRTPTRRLARHVSFAAADEQSLGPGVSNGEDAVVDATPLKAALLDRDDLVGATPQRPASRIRSIGDSGLTALPASLPVQFDAPALDEKAELERGLGWDRNQAQPGAEEQQRPEQDIYAALGWDDDYDL